MEFTKYSSIENHYRDKYIDKILHEFPDSGNYVVTEKIHGANYSIISDGKEVVAAKRSGLIGEGGSFFNHYPVFEKYKRRVTQLHGFFGPQAHIRVVGELYGKGIQKEIDYKDEQDFIVFDIFIDGQPIRFHNLQFLCAQVHLPVVPVLAEGLSLQEALEFDVEFNTTLNPKEGNITEGIVIKPNTPIFLSNGNRVIIKKKNDKFLEQGKGKAKVKTELVLTESQKTLLETFLPYINENRVSNVISKIGEVTNKDFGKIMGLTIQDALEDYKKDHDDLDKELWNSVRKLVNKEASNIIRPLFLTLKE